MRNLLEKKLKIVFHEMLAGKSQAFDELDSKNLYIKHYGDYDSSIFDQYYINFYNKAIDEGLPSEADKLKFLINEKVWSSENESKIEYLESKLNKLKELKNKTYLLSQLERLKKELVDIEFELTNLKNKKSQLLDFTAEKYADNKMEYYYILNSFYLDEDLKNRKFTEEADDIETFGQLNHYTRLHNQTLEKFKLQNIKRIAIASYSMSAMALSQNNAYYFFGKPIALLTYYQSTYFSYANYYEKISSNSEYKNVPEDIKKDVDKLIDFYSATSNLRSKVNQEKDVNGPVFVMDATEKDLDFLNKSKTKHDKSALDRLAEEHGGVLDLNQLANFYNKK